MNTPSQDQVETNPQAIKERARQALITALEPLSEVKAVWEAGSAATGTSDEYSDLDLVIVSTNEAVDVFEKVEEALRSVAPISHQYNEASDGEFTHRIYFLENAPKHFYLDIGVTHPTSKATLGDLLQTERHGSPVVHFDKKAIVQRIPLDLEAIKKEQRQKLSEHKAALPVIFTSIEKKLDRGHTVDAFAFYFGLLRRYTEILGMRYRPERYDFGLRYIKRDFPKEVYARLNEYFFVKDPDELRKLLKEIKVDIHKTLELIEDDSLG